MKKQEAIKGGINRLCARCEKSCKQHPSSKVISCPFFVAKLVQMEIKLSYPRLRKKLDTA
ncbi:MAG: hypothetical protein PHI68_06810 [Candidatus Cloacimonetes bacterium]|nr:hypothetical protein [Candidatus Cloacimonadota bacterium]